MSRAFVKDDVPDEPPRTYRLPPRDDPTFAMAAAAALLEGARVGDTDSAELATGIAFGDPSLIQQIERLRQDAITRGDDRLEQVADRYLRRAGR